MSPAVAQKIFVVFNFIAILAVGYVINNVISVASSLASKQPVISLDTGIGYLVLMSVFWLLSLVQYIGRKNRQHFVFRRASQLILAWFIASLILAYAIPKILQEQLENSGYISCHNPQELSRVSKGTSLIFIYKNAVAEKNEQANKQSVCEQLQHN